MTYVTVGVQFINWLNSHLISFPFLLVQNLVMLFEQGNIKCQSGACCLETDLGMVTLEGHIKLPLGEFPPILTSAFSAYF